MQENGLGANPHSGGVRIIVGPALPDVIPSPSEPMLCNRKSLYGWNVCFASALLTLELIGVPPVEGGMNDAGLEAVVKLGVWQPEHPNWRTEPGPPMKTKFGELSAEARALA